MSRCIPSLGMWPIEGGLKKSGSTTSDRGARCSRTHALTLYLSFFLPFFFELPWLATGEAAASAGMPGIIPVGRNPALGNAALRGNRGGLAGPPGGRELPRRRFGVRGGERGLRTARPRAAARGEPGPDVGTQRSHLSRREGLGNLAATRDPAAAWGSPCAILAWGSCQRASAATAFC